MAGLLAGAPGSSDAAAAGARTATGSGTVISPRSPIRHVVIIYQENHTFDDVLGGLCEVRANPCDGTTSAVTMRDGTTAQNIVQPDLVPGVDHSPKAQRAAMRNDWNDIGGCEKLPYACVSHVDPDNIPNLTALANTFAVSDRTFAAGRAASFGAHVTLGAGTYDGFSGLNPVRSITGVKPRAGWGCVSRRDILWGPRGDKSMEPSCIPDRKGHGPYRASRVPYAPTIMERLEQAGLTWHIYEGEDSSKPLIGLWSVCTYFAWCQQHRFNLKHDSQRSDFLVDAADGTLPRLSLLLPTGGSPFGGVSQHNGNSMRLGDNYIGDVVGAAMNGPDWESTAIFITYDDCGCFYDHVTPPHQSMGLRNPMVIVSPWATPQGTDSRNAVQPYSMLAFTEHVFGLEPLSTEVTNSYDYADAFDFDQPPITDVPAMVTQSISEREKRRLAMLAPSVREDPT